MNEECKIFMALYLLSSRLLIAFGSTFCTNVVMGIVLPITAMFPAGATLQNFLLKHLMFMHSLPIVMAISHFLLLQQRSTQDFCVFTMPTLLNSPASIPPRNVAPRRVNPR